MPPFYHEEKNVILINQDSVLLDAASYVGIKEYVPPYLDPTLSIEELMTGVSFASAGSGFDPLTPQLSVGLSFLSLYFSVLGEFS